MGAGEGRTHRMACEENIQAEERRRASVVSEQNVSLGFTARLQGMQLLHDDRLCRTRRLRVACSRQL